MQYGMRLCVLLLVLSAGSADAQQRRPAPAPKPTVPQEVEALKEEVRTLKERIIALEAEIARLRERLPADARTDANDARIAKGLRDKKLVPGMTLLQVRGICGTQGTPVEQGTAGDLYRFQLPNRMQVLEGGGNPAPFGEYLIFVTFRDGKATAFRRVDLPNVPARPAD